MSPQHRGVGIFLPLDLWVTDNKDSTPLNRETIFILPIGNIYNLSQLLQNQEAGLWHLQNEETGPRHPPRQTPQGKWPFLTSCCRLCLVIPFII
jgi:hypothetical protein